MAPNLKAKPIEIREVWSDNLYKEFYRISNALVRFPIVSMDTEFPGVIYHPTRRNSIRDGTLVYFLRPVSNYQALKANVDALKLIQVGLTLSDSTGNLPDFGTGTCYIWQFNFRDYDISNDYYTPESIELLKRQRIDFEKNLQKGIDATIFDREVGNRHQAGSDSLITLKTFLKIKEKFFGGGNYYKLFAGVLCGLELASFTARTTFSNILS
ncbi:hypothetical protein MKX03_018815 [Papaver bracteatum]|nr:hypothetical protein MKX03_018815 [Papaver bracteatum]